MCISEPGLCLSFRWHNPLPPCVRPQRVGEWGGGARRSHNSKEDTYHGMRKRRAPSPHFRCVSSCGGERPERDVPFFRRPKFKCSRCTCHMRDTRDSEIRAGGGGSTRTRGSHGRSCLSASAFQTEDSVPLCWIQRRHEYVRCLEFCLTVLACFLSAISAETVHGPLQTETGALAGQFRTFHK